MTSISTGSFITVRGEDYQVRKVVAKADDTHLIHAEGVSELVKGLPFIFDESLEDHITIQDASKAVLKADNSNKWQKTKLHLETQVRNTAVHSSNLVIGHKAAINPSPYQFDPVVKALKLPRPRMLIADGVGLGKTIEAGVFMSEMIKRGKGDRILVLALKSILAQFQQEIWSRFSIPLVKLDSQGIARVKAELPANKNPFDYYDKTIISIDTLKNNAKFRHYIEKSYWDIIVIDECHTVSNIQSLRGDLANFLSTRCESLVLTSATPHNGKRESFANLVRMIEPVAIPKNGVFTKKDVEPYYVRRFKKDIGEEAQESFRDREIHKLSTDLSVPEEEFLKFQQEMKSRSLSRQNEHDILFSIGLFKAYLSSPEACLETLKNREKRIREKPEADGYEIDLEEIRKAISQVQSIIQTNSDSRYNRLLNHFSSKNWSGRPRDPRYIIFTERVKTAKSLSEKLRTHFGLDQESVKTFHGSLTDMEQQEIIEDFGKGDSKIRLLIATDAGSQGVNLHYHCNHMINYDIPWSIITLEQRNGRIDRYGQKQTPHIYYLVADSELDGLKTDLHIIKKLMEKEDVIYHTLGDAGSVMKLYEPDKEQQRVEKAIEQSDTDFLDKDEIFDFSVLFDGEDEVTPTVSDATVLEERISLFDSDFDYYLSLTRYLQAHHLIDPNELEFIPEDRHIRFLNSRQLSEHLYHLPHEARPKPGYFYELTSDKNLVQQSIEEARKTQREWPRFQMLYDLHPIAAYWMSKLEAHVDKNVATVVQFPHLPENSCHFVFQGIVSNNLGQPLVSRFFVISLDADGAMTDPVMELEEYLVRHQLQKFEDNLEVETAHLAQIETILPEAVESARIYYIDSKKNELQDSMLHKLEEYEKQLQNWKNDAIEQLELDFGQHATGVVATRKKHQLTEIEDITSEKSRYYQDMFALDNEAHLKLITVFYHHRA